MAPIHLPVFPRPSSRDTIRLYSVGCGDGAMSRHCLSPPLRVRVDRIDEDKVGEMLTLPRAGRQAYTAV
jgi:hypothetical protein